MQAAGHQSLESTRQMGMGARKLKAKQSLRKMTTLHQHIVRILTHASSSRTTGVRACTPAAALVLMLGPH